MNEETQAAFTTMRDHLDQIQKINSNSETAILALINDNHTQIRALTRKIQTLSESKILHLTGLTKIRFELIIQTTDDPEQHLAQITMRIKEHFI